MSLVPDGFFNYQTLPRVSDDTVINLKEFINNFLSKAWWRQVTLEKNRPVDLLTMNVRFAD